MDPNVTCFVTDTEDLLLNEDSDFVLRRDEDSIFESETLDVYSVSGISCGRSKLLVWGVQNNSDVLYLSHSTFHDLHRFHREESSRIDQICGGASFAL
jgi:hypothetical protein